MSNEKEFVITEDKQGLWISSPDVEMADIKHNIHPKGPTYHFVKMLQSENASLKERVRELGYELKKLSESTAIAEAETSDLEQEIEKIKEAIGCVIQYDYKFIQDPNYESIAWIVTSYGQKRGQFSNIPTHGFKHIK